MPPAEFAAESGLAGVDLSDYAHGRFELEISVDVPASAATGQVTARGAVLPECSTNPPEPRT